MNGSTSLLITSVTSVFLAGVLLTLLRNLKAPLARHLGTTEGRVNRLQAAFTLVLIPMMLGSGVLIDKWGLQTVLVGGALLAALGITALEPSRTDRSAWPGVLMTGAGAAALAVASIVLLPRGFLPRNATAAMNLGFLFFALGALLTPTLMGWLERRWGFRPALLVLALACLVPAALGIVLSASDLDSPAVAGDLGQLLGQPALWVAGLVIVLYQPVEEALGVWTRGYLKDLGHEEARTSLWLWLFWAVFLATRLAAGLVLRPGYETWLVLFLGLFATVALGNLIGTYQPTAGGFGLLILAVCLAPLLPTLLGLVYRVFPADRGAACGLLLALGAAGTLLLPAPLHPAAERHSPRGAMRLSLALTLVLTCAALVLALVR